MIHICKGEEKSYSFVFNKKYTFTITSLIEYQSRTDSASSDRSSARSNAFVDPDTADVVSTAWSNVDELFRRPAVQT